MIHGPCVAFNNNSSCMCCGKCTKRYKKMVSDTITGNDGYPLYRRRSVENGGKSVVLKVRNIDIEVDNRYCAIFTTALNVKQHTLVLLVNGSLRSWECSCTAR
ncbi:helitron_like_N domain-containing protein [Trichonephila clavipes]|uniref:Helitron_like_N domain-containing protein n=1 Tax=Trichonephila clavipes TaxID=2585209 RepID=A0A8X6SY34_TRICX|nr:helitron_like_N domain-containing protein [Trichonephila clavipes]